MMTVLKEITREEFDLWWVEHGEFAEQVTGMPKETYWQSVQSYLGKSLADICTEHPNVEAWLREWNIIKGE